MYMLLKTKKQSQGGGNKHKNGFIISTNFIVKVGYFMKRKYYDTMKHVRRWNGLNVAFTTKKINPYSFL